MALAVIAGAAALLLGSGGDEPADDSWGTGQTLEWATSSPPVPGNFGELALVGSPEPLLDAAATAEEA
jgi:heme/copper-type cytochrome/quinol oxidase subunit 1